MKDLFAQENPEFVSLFQNKTVAIVAGRPPQAQSCKAAGAQIDRADVVVRLNNCHEVFPWTEKFKYSKGTRCDVLFRESNDFHHVYATTGNAHGYVKKLRAMKVKDVFFFSGNRAAEFNHISRGNPKFTQLTSYAFNVLTAILGTREKIPSTGLVALFCCALSQPKVLKAHGFSFYTTGLRDNAEYLNPEIISCELALRFHDFSRELQVFKSLILNLCSIDVDDDMPQLLL